MKSGKLLTFSAPSGSGKTTILYELLKDENLNLTFSISATTREPRGTEADGVDYYFMTVEEFKRHIDAGDFAEWEEVYSGVFYGTLKSEIERLTKTGKNIVFDVDVKGALSIKELYPDSTYSIFVRPPSIEELRNRLIHRGDDLEKIEVRLKKAEDELVYERKFDKVVVNNNLQRAIGEARLFVEDFLE